MEAKTHTILIVEDDAGILELLKDSIEDAGCSAICMQTGRTAIDWLKVNTPFLVVLDYGLPDMNGKELIGELLNNGIVVPPFIVSTGQGDEHIAVDMMKLGAKDYIVKDNQFLEMIPILIEHVCNEIENELKLKKNEQELIELNQFNSQIIDSALEGIIVCDQNMNYITWNPFMERITGILAKDIIGKNAKVVFPYLKEVGVIDGIDNALKGIIGSELEFVFDFNSSGKQGWVSDAVSSLKNVRGEIIGAISIVRDITDSKTAELALKNKMDEMTRFHRMIVGRELAMVELKKEINELLKETGREEKYRVVE